MNASSRGKPKKGPLEFFRAGSPHFLLLSFPSHLRRRTFRLCALPGGYLKRITRYQSLRALYTKISLPFAFLPKPKCTRTQALAKIAVQTKTTTGVRVEEKRAKPLTVCTRARK